MDWRERDAQRRQRHPEVNFAALCQGAADCKRWWIGLPLAAMLLIGAVLCLQAPVYSAEAQISIGPRMGGMIGLRPSAAFLNASGGCGAAIGQARLIGSRELARRVIKDLGIENEAEFDPAARGLGPAFRALIFLGIMGDPARQSRDDRILEAFQERLRESGPGREGLLTIAFRSEDSELAANAANRVAELYLDMHADVSRAMPCETRARVVSRAIPPLSPVYPKEALLILSGAAMIIMGLGAGVAIALPRLPSCHFKDDFAEQPRALGEARVFIRCNENANLHPRLAAKFDVPSMADEAESGAPDNDQAVEKIVTHILAVAASAPRGIRILARSLEANNSTSSMMLDLARSLAYEGRAIAISFDPSNLLESGNPVAAAPHCIAIGTEPALEELLAGTASFAEVIRRDPASRLHFLPIGCKREIGFHEFAAVLDALGATYDFIIMFAPPIGQDENAKELAAATDLAVLAVPIEPGGAAFEAERQLMESGVREVLLIAVTSGAWQGLGRDAA
jgi:hypothetical protein